MNSIAICVHQSGDRTGSCADVFEGANATDPLIVDGAASSIGNTASLRINHTGLLLGQTVTDSTGRRLTFEADAGTQYQNPLYSADYTALQSLNDTDIRGQGYSMDATSWAGVSYGGALTADQSVGQHTTYKGSAAVGVLSTNKETGNDVIFAGAGDDVVNAGAGDDWLFGGAGQDNISGGDGSDFLHCAIYLVASNEHQSGVTGRFNCEYKVHKTRTPCLRWRVDRSSIKTAHADSMRLTEHKELGGRMDAVLGNSDIQIDAQKQEMQQ